MELLTDDEYGGESSSAWQPIRRVRVVAGCVRWSDERGDKSGGVRMIYYHIDVPSLCRMLLIYRKDVKDDLATTEKKTLRKLNENW